MSELDYILWLAFLFCLFAVMIGLGIWIIIALYRGEIDISAPGGSNNLGPF
jgi:hypothetical protein